jgi:hypothetical protein
MAKSSMMDQAKTQRVINQRPITISSMETLPQMGATRGAGVYDSAVREEELLPLVNIRSSVDTSGAN